MDRMRRVTLLALATLPAACSIQPLAPVRTAPLQGASGPIRMRPPALGQSWTYQKFNGYNSALLATEREVVSAVEPGIIVQRGTDAGQPLPQEQGAIWGQLLRDPAWDYPQNYVDPVPLWPQDLAVGARATVRTEYRIDDLSYRFWIAVHTEVKAWEKLQVPLGEFNALRVERWIGMQHPDIARSLTTRHDRLWLVPEIGRWVVRETSGEYVTARRQVSRAREDIFRWELSAWT